MIEGGIFTNDRSKNPTMEELFGCFRDCYNQNPTFVDFWVKPEGLVICPKVRINVLIYESGAPGMLRIEGFLREAHRGHTCFVAFYNVNDGTGHIKLLMHGESE